ncbi:MAG: FCD domain-containing protein, partial [Clostridia bacterium]
EACENAGKHLDSWDAFAKYDMIFHHTIAEASKNPLFIQTAEMIESMYTVWLIGFQRNHGVEKSHDFHYNICQAVARHDANAAATYMKEHLEDVLSKVIQDAQSK